MRSEHRGLTAPPLGSALDTRHADGVEAVRSTLARGRFSVSDDVLEFHAGDDLRSSRLTFENADGPPGVGYAYVTTHAGESSEVTDSSPHPRWFDLDGSRTDERATHLASSLDHATNAEVRRVVDLYASLDPAASRSLGDAMSLTPDDPATPTSLAILTPGTSRRRDVGDATRALLDVAAGVPAEWALRRIGVRLS